MIDRASELRAIADGRLMLNVRNGVTVSRSMLARIADEFEAMSTALAAKDAELAGALEASERFSVAWRDAEKRAERAEAELAELHQELGETRLVLEQTERNAERNIKMRDAQLAETRKVLNAGEALSRQLHAVIDQLNGQAYSSTLSALNYFDATRPAEQAVTEAMVEAGARAVAQAWGADWECCCAERRGLDCDCGDAMPDERDGYDERLSREDCRMAARAALKAAMEADR